MGRGRAPSGEGTVIYRKDRRLYYAVVSQDGKRVWGKGRRTRKEAEVDRRAMVEQVEAKVPLRPAAITLKEFMETWIEATKHTVAPSTYELNQVVLIQLAPIHDVLLADLTPVKLASTFSHLIEQGGRQGQGLATKTVRNVAATLRTALAQAVEWKLLPSNPMDGVKLPSKARRHKLRVWTQEEVKAFLATNPPLIFQIALQTGLRRGELAALEWRDFDLERGVVRVNKSLGKDGQGGWAIKAPKTPHSNRTVTLPPSLVASLVPGEGRLVEVQPPTLSRQWKRYVARLDLPQISLHDARHTHATLLLQAGVSPDVVSRRLGHSDVATTLSIYAHELPNSDEQAALIVDELLK